ncbi:large cysteine-rich periplasmic omcB domain protein, partial [Chlamydia psittaci 84-8471/1]
ICKRKGRPRIS